MKLKYKNVKLIEVNDWDEFITKIYNRPYSLQQQDDGKPRGIIILTIPPDYLDDDDMNDSISEIVNGDEMGVKFRTWLARDPKQGFNGNITNITDLILFWHRNFYPDLYTIANDLWRMKKIEVGQYYINIDW
jgi:hypothetical protein